MCMHSKQDAVPRTAHHMRTGPGDDPKARQFLSLDGCAGRNSDGMQGSVQVNR
jgi:hypothetical protein